MGKRIFCFVVLLTLLFSVYSIVFSQSNQSKIDVLFDDIKLAIDGKEINADGEIFKYNGKTYAPISTVVKGMGGEGLFDKYQNKLSVTSYKDFPECDYLGKEIFVYGIITKIDYEKKEIEVEQHFDDNSMEVSPILKAREDVVIIVERNENRMNIQFKDLKVGDIVGLILDKEKLIRGMIMSV